MLRKEELPIILILIGIVVFFSIKSCWDEKEIEGNEVFVVGKLIYSDFGGSETGWVYKVKYKFKGLEYYKGFTGPVNRSFLRDSLVVLRISEIKPDLSRHVLDLVISNCISRDSILNRSWKTWPPSCP